MITPATLIQLKAFARQDGLFLALYWTASFALTMLSPQSVWGNMIAMGTPLFMGWRLCAFRDEALNGVISFRRGLAHGVYSVMYASLAFALVQYVYFRFLDDGTFMTMLSDGLEAFKIVYQQQGQSTAELDQALASMQQVSPMQWTFMLMLQNMFIGSVLALPVAAICTRRTPRS